MRPPLIYLGIALATGSTACIESMTNKAQARHIDTEKLVERFKIARFAEATRVLANAETLFAKLATTLKPQVIDLALKVSGVGVADSATFTFVPRPASRHRVICQQEVLCHQGVPGEEVPGRMGTAPTRDRTGYGEGDWMQTCGCGHVKQSKAGTTINNGVECLQQLRQTDLQRGDTRQDSGGGVPGHDTS